jgi:O-antigen/teichoic acid export membrane protein
MNFFSLSRSLPAALVAHLAGRDVLQKILRNTGWLFAGKMIRMGVGLFVGVWVSRYLGPQRFGLYNYAIALVTLFSSLATLGLNNIVVRDIVLLPSCRNEILGSAFGLRLCGGVAALLLAISVSAISRPHDLALTYLVAVIAAGTVFSAFDAIDFWFQSQLMSKFTVLAKNAAFILISVTKVVLIVCKAPLLMFAAAGAAEIMLGAFGLLIAYERAGGGLRLWRFKLSRAKSLLRDSWPLIFSGILGSIHLRIDQIMLGEMVGDEEVGVYAAAVRLAEAWYFISMTLMASALPSLIEAQRISEEFFYLRLQKLYNLMALLAYAIAVPTTFLSDAIVGALFGSAYAGAGPMLALLIWAVPFINLGVARSAFFTAMNWTKTSLVVNGIGCIANIVLNWFLIPSYQGMGAVVATLVAYGVMVVLVCFFYRPLFRTGRMLLKAMFYPRIWY